MMARIYSTSDATANRSARRAPRQAAAEFDISAGGADDAAALFAQLFPQPKATDLPPVDALALFIEYSELTPIGRRGDEMIRAADRWSRLTCSTGQRTAAIPGRSSLEVRAPRRSRRAAMVYLMKSQAGPRHRALRTHAHRRSRRRMRQQRLLLEARAQSEYRPPRSRPRHHSNITGREAIRLRSDIYWRRGAGANLRADRTLLRATAGALQTLSTTERGDVLRAVVGYALRKMHSDFRDFREKYAPLMTARFDRAAFEVAKQPLRPTAPNSPRSPRWRSVDTLDGFLREMRRVSPT